jgi:hypothetical protein
MASGNHCNFNSKTQELGVNQLNGSMFFIIRILFFSAMKLSRQFKVQLAHKCVNDVILLQNCV